MLPVVKLPEVSVMLHVMEITFAGFPVAVVGVQLDELTKPIAVDGVIAIPLKL